MEFFMRFIELTDEQITDIYNTHMQVDFPKSEIKPLKVILEAKAKGFYVCFGLFDIIKDCENNNGDEKESVKEKLVAYAFLANDRGKRLFLLDYLAVIHGLRGSGYGGKMLSKLKEYFYENTFVNALIIEAESIGSSENEEEVFVRKRRIHFYKKNGLLEQPFLSEVFGTVFTILILWIREEEINILEEYKNIYKSILTADIYEKNIKIL